VLPDEASYVMKSTWAFKLKRLADGTPSNFKARYCVRGDFQKEGGDFWRLMCLQSWSTIWILLDFILPKNALQGR